MALVTVEKFCCLSGLTITIDGTGDCMDGKKVSQSRTVKAMLVLPPDSNALGTMVTASTDSVDFLYPINIGQMICLESFVTWTHRTSMEIYVNIISEDLKTGERRVCASSFLTFVAIDEHGKTQAVPPVIPETEFEKELHRTASQRFERRMERKTQSKMLAEKFPFRRL